MLLNSLFPSLQNASSLTDGNEGGCYFTIIVDGVKKARDFCDTAVITLHNFSGENYDRKAEKGQFYITDNDAALIEKVTAVFSNTIIVLNNSGIMDLSFIEENDKISAAILAGLNGMEGAQAIADILGMELKIEEMEFDSIITAVSSGKAQMGVSGMTVTEDRLKNINFTTPYTTAKQVIIVRNGVSDSTAFVSVEKFKNDFIVENRWQYLANGLLTTLKISLFSAIIGIILGFLIAVARVSCDKTKRFKLLNLILKGYLTIIRGTPAMIQLK